MSDGTSTRGIEIDGENKTVEATRALRKSGGSNVVTIPPGMIDLLDFEIGDDVTLVADWSGDEIRLRVVEEEGAETTDDDGGADSDDV